MTNQITTANDTKYIHNLDRQDIIITGAMGFIGSYVLAKLLHSVPDSGRLFIIVRARKNVLPAERLSELVKKSGDLFKNVDLARIVVVEGDCMSLETTVSHEAIVDMANVSVLIHIAASVDWKLPYEDALKANDVTKIYSWARDHFKNLRSFIQTSTSYSSPMTNLHVTETFDEHYEEMKYKHEAFANSYTWSKYIAEHELRNMVLAQPETGDFSMEPDCHVAIVRPGIVGGALGTDSFAPQGWNINMNTINGAFLLYGAWKKNVTWLVPARKNVRCNVTPVDLVSNMLILTAAKLMTSTLSTREVEIINCVQAEDNVTTWGKFMKIFSPHPRQLIYVKSKSQYETLFKLLVQYPSHFIRNGQYKLDRLREGLEIMLVFTIYDYQFETTKLLQLHNEVSAIEHRNFPVYFQNFSYHDYVLSCFNYATAHIIRPLKSVIEGFAKRKLLEKQLAANKKKGPIIISSLSAPTSSVDMQTDQETTATTIEEHNTMHPSTVSAL